MLKQALAVIAGALVTASLWAAPELRPDHPESYTVRKGDTLWDISARFLKSPWLWPEIWQANPQIANPHLIYPGDVVSLVYIDGQPRLVVNQDGGGTTAMGPTGPRIRVEGGDEPVAPLPLSALQQFLERTRLLSKAEIDAAPYLVGLEENRQLAMNTQLAYARRLEGIAPGTRLAVMRPTVVYREVKSWAFWRTREPRPETREWSTVSTGNIADRLWSNWVDADQGSVLGYEVLQIGIAEVVRNDGDPATVYLEYVDQEIRRGDLLLPLLPRGGLDLEFVPHAPERVPDGMRVVAQTDALASVGPNQVVAFNRGRIDGVENGQTYSVWNQGERIPDEVRNPEGQALAVFTRNRNAVTLPDEFAGHVMVFRTFDRVSYGLVMDAIKPLKLGDEARPPVNL